MTETFLYFAYGSNLLKQRLLLKNPSAVYKGIAKLMDYRLAMRSRPCSNSWHGAVATIERHPGGHVWGVVWQLDAKDRGNLDEQEKWYTGYDVTVQDENGRQYVCRTYQMNERTSGLPSPQYKDIIIRGAKQNGLPEDYIKTLENMKDNGFQGHVQLYEDALRLLEKPQ